MSDSLLYLIVGGGIAIISGGLSHFLNNYFKYRHDKNRYVLEKLEDIIECVSILEQMLQKDISGILKLLDPEDSKMSINISFQQNKLNCLVNIYHKDLSKPLNELNEKIKQYHKRKIDIINFQRKPKEGQTINDLYNELSNDFTQRILSCNNFIDDLSRYGNKKVN
tara:strand:- start:1745 stop:2242 length:498 start_codon:yes stop_codon:yes gene_type:complete